MAHGVGADRRYLRLRAREVDAQVTGEVVVRDVLHLVRHGVGRRHTNRAVSEDDPDCFGRPCVAAECLLQLRRVCRGQRFGFGVLAVGEHVNLPRDARGVVVDRRVGVLAAGAAHRRVPVFVDDVLRADLRGCANVVRDVRGGGCGGVRARGVLASGAAAVERRNCVLARNAIHIQGVRQLEVTQRLICFDAEDAVRRTRREVAEVNQPLLHCLDCRAVVAPVERGGAGNHRCGGGRIHRRNRRRGGRGGGRGGVEGNQRFVARHAVTGESISLLEVVDGFGGRCAVNAVCRAGEVAKGNQPLLERADGFARHAAAEGDAHIHRCARHDAVAADCGCGVEQHLRVIARDAVHRQPVHALEGADSRCVVRHADPVAAGIVVAQRRQPLLQTQHRVAARALADGNDVVLRDGRGGRSRCRQRGGRWRGGNDVIRRNCQIAEQHLISACACNAIGAQTVLGLELLQRVHARRAENAVRDAGEIAQINQPLLHKARVIAGRTLADGCGRRGQRGQVGRRGGCGHGHFHGRQRTGGGGSAHQLLLRRRAARAVGL